MPDDPGAIVTAFIAEFDTEHPDIDRLLSYFTDDAVYHNMPVQPAKGREAIREGLRYTQQLAARGWEIVNQAVTADVVLNERVDRFEVGGRQIELPVCGVFEVRDGKIAAWRDYFDMGVFRSLISPPEGGA